MNEEIKMIKDSVEDEKFEHKGKKPQEKIEYYFMRPQYRPILGVTVTKDTDIDDVTEDGKVHQTIKDLIFTTKIKKSVESDENGEDDYLSITEDTTLTVKLKEGTRLIWQEGSGYILPQSEFLTLKEILKDYEYLKDIEGV